jgi:uncharacterized protein (DUF4415 family)
MKSESSRSEKPQSGRRGYSPANSATDWPRLTSGDDSGIVLTTEHPEASAKHIVRGVVRRGLKPLPVKSPVSLRVDRDVLEWFKAQGRDYRGRMNSVLRAFRDASL